MTTLSMGLHLSSFVAAMAIGRLSRSIGYRSESLTLASAFVRSKSSFPT